MNAPLDFAFRFVVENHLVAPVSIDVDGAPFVRLWGGETLALTVPSTAQWLTWNSAKPLDSQGRVIPDDIGETQVGVAGIQGRLELTNVINDQKYITAGFLNNTDAPVTIGVFDGSATACASVLPAKQGAVPGFTQMGYYKLLPKTEIRAFRYAECAGPFIAWGGTQLQAFDSKSGLLRLVLDSAP